MQNRLYSHFWRGMHERARQKGFPLRVMFEVTYRCNFHCKHCYIPRQYKNKKELKTKEIFSILDQLADLGCLYLGFTGGEPFLRRDFFDIVAHAAQKGFQIIIYSNGSCVDEESAAMLKRFRVNKIDITVPAFSRAAFERITGVAGSREKVFHGIRLLYRRHMVLGFKTCILKETGPDELRKIRSFARSLRALHRVDYMLSPRLNGDTEPYKYRGTLGKQREAEDTSLISCSVNGGIKGTKERRAESLGLFPCGAGISQAAITPAGELKLCLMIDYPKYKILSVSLKDAWVRLKKMAARIRPDRHYTCGRCQLRRYCPWCPARSWLQTKNFTGCEPESKYWAKLISQYREIKN